MAAPLRGPSWIAGDLSQPGLADAAVRSTPLGKAFPVRLRVAR